jgi:hypothetical protein
VVVVSAAAAVGAEALDQEEDFKPEAGMINRLTFARRSTVRSLVRFVAACAVLVVASSATAQEFYQTPDEAAAALVAAAKAADRAAVMRVLGPGSADIVSSGDPVADVATRKRFIEAYDAKHDVKMDAADKAILIVGAQSWPFPIPLVRQDGKWRFDAAAGREEILLRRIGRNELRAIQASLAYVDAQQDYAEKDRGSYAQRIVSRAGKKDGLYWPAKEGEERSPLGELAARASAEGYVPGGQRAPYHGYFFKILTRQGPNAPGGAMDYVVRGNMIGGFALVAYPAEYKNSGVMTFLVNHRGQVFEKDLGPNTARLAAGMTAFDPDNTWVVNAGLAGAR